MKIHKIAMIALLSAGVPMACTSGKPSGTITIDGSDTVYPLSKAMAAGFGQANPEVRFTIDFSGTGGGFRKFCAGQVDIEGASRPIKAAEGEQCKAKHIDYIELPVAFDSLSVVVNPKNSFVDCLTVQELKAVWEPPAEGKLTNWQQVRASFPAQPLVLFGPGQDSGTFDYFTFAIVGTEASSRGDYTKSEDYTVVERGVAADANALGYFPYSFYQANKDQLKLVAIDNGHGCIPPSPQTVATGAYEPLARPLFLYVNTAAAARPEVKEFVHFYLALGSAEYVTKVGYVPLSAAALALQISRFDKGVKGSALGAHGSVLGLNLDWLNVSEEDKIKAQLVQ
jgi:phosphate transport system substrate-binding protein